MTAERRRLERMKAIGNYTILVMRNKERTIKKMAIDVEFIFFNIVVIREVRKGKRVAQVMNCN